EALSRVQSLQWGFDLGFLDVEVEGDLLIGVAHLLATEILKSREQWYMRDGIPKFAKEAVEKDG
ncbi:hypothetical protein Goari_003036, partial [Gossypium aridum]|nr:hypothetical protein [Gossypium aridum]